MVSRSSKAQDAGPQKLQGMVQRYLKDAVQQQDSLVNGAGGVQSGFGGHARLQGMLQARVQRQPLSLQLCLWHTHGLP